MIETDFNDEQYPVYLMGIVNDSSEPVRPEGSGVVGFINESKDPKTLSFVNETGKKYRT